MKIAGLLFIVLLSLNSTGQTANSIKLHPLENDFFYIIDDSLAFKGTGWICTLPVSTVFTKVYFDNKNSRLSIEGYFMLAGEPTDTVNLGISGASIFLLNFNNKIQLTKVFDLGETSDNSCSKKHSGYFSRIFSITKGDILLLGIPGEVGGANAFDVGELLKH